MLQFKVGRGVGNEQAASVTDRGAAHKAVAANRGVNDGHVFGKLGFEYAVKVFGAANA